MSTEFMNEQTPDAENNKQNQKIIEDNSIMYQRVKPSERD